MSGSGRNSGEFLRYKLALAERLRASKTDLATAILVALGMYSAGETDDLSAASFLGLSIREMGELQEMVVSEALSFFEGQTPQVARPQVAGWLPDTGMCPACGRPNVTNLPLCASCMREDGDVDDHTYY